MVLRCREDGEARAGARWWSKLPWWRDGCCIWMECDRDSQVVAAQI